MKNLKKLWKLGRKDFNTEHFDINADGELVIREGNYQYNVYDLARKFGASIEIFLPFILEQRLSRLMETASDNIKRLGYALARVFHYQECLPVEELKVKGYDLLRQMVINICSGLSGIDDRLAQNWNYQKVVTVLFTKHGIKAP